MEGESVKAVLGGGWSASWLCTGTHTHTSPHYVCTLIFVGCNIICMYFCGLAAIRESFSHANLDARCICTAQ